MNAINWTEVRALNSSQRDGFEELCAQLGRAETPADADFVRTGNPDSGVECYCVFPNGDEWGWQAKYFLSSPGAAQWRQIDDSVKAALYGHPSLMRYIVCVPTDLPDGRRPKETSARQRWNQLVQEWEQVAMQAGMSVKFELWDASALISRLTKPEHAGTLRYWFDASVFDDAWFRSRLDESKRTAGPRYTPEIHVSASIPAAEDLETFARTEGGISRIKSLAVAIRRRAWLVSQSERDCLESEHGLPFSNLTTSVAAILQKLADLQYSPVGRLPFSEIITDLDSAIGAASQIEDQLQDLVFEDERRSENQYASSDYRNALGSFRYVLPELQKAKTEITRASEFANGNLMVLTGKAGVGKTHLLCDFAERHFGSGTPAVLLMGQRFTSADDPIRQILAQLDYPQDGTFEEFIGALETAAKVAGRRALVIVDALNEGQGQTLWYPNLAALVDRISKSPWIGLVLSVREEYLNDVIPGDVESIAQVSTHYGFEGVEFDAAKTFFEYYNLELPSTPILQPEFSNPLWLKIICEGLSSAGERRLPRGMHGITKLLSLYTQASNQKLAKPDALDYDASSNLVERAISKLAERMVRDNAAWLDRTDALKVVDQLLPNRTFSKSLYRGLVTEGMLTELKGSGGNADIVVFAYERVADHLKVKFLLNGVDADSAEKAFDQGGPLEFLHDGSYVPEGIIEALHTQIPEKTGKELVELSPKLGERFGAVEPFSQSIIWRSPDAVTDTTKQILSRLVQRQDYSNPALDALLTIAVVQDHPLNADYLDLLLRSNGMADRDAWWSVHLHRSWGDNGPVDRLTEWASSVAAKDLSDEALDLAATTLAWLLTASNRFVRDKATKALVSLLDGRLAAAERLVERFAEVDDPYVMERIYAVAYGVTMRSGEASEVGRLAELVYNHVFARCAPPPHILMRDYARGVIERTAYLGVDLGIDLTSIRPPYKSAWPKIPSEEEIEALNNRMEKLAGKQANVNQGWSDIIFSVGDAGDFGRYIIGTNSSYQSRDWLAITLDDEQWQSYDQRKATLISQLDPEERTALEQYDEANRDATVFPTFVFVPPPPDAGGDILETPSRIVCPAGKRITTHLASRMRLAMAKGHLVTSLSEEHLSQWRMLNVPSPRLDLRIVQRYILDRVVKLGWNTERFGEFDHFVDRAHNAGRRARKAERIGKKYQWIAYQEILAFISDRYQYHPEWEDSQRYDGPWQTGLRDIDPSASPLSKPSATESSLEYPPTWWAPMEYENWQPSIATECWVADHSDIPALDKNLIVENPSVPGAVWINAYCFQSNRQPHPADVDKYDGEGREVWQKTTAYLVTKGKADDFIEWVTAGGYWTNEWVSSVPESQSVFLGEHAWSRSSTQQYEAYDEDRKEWSYPDGAASVPAHALAASYSTTFSEYDCSVGENEGDNLYLPSPSIVQGCLLRWNGRNADYVDNAGAIAAFDPSAHELGPNALLIRAEVLEQFMVDHDLELCWAVIGEKQTTGTSGQPYGWLKMFGAYAYRDGQPSGEHLCQFVAPNPR